MIHEHGDQPTSFWFQGPHRSGKTEIARRIRNRFGEGFVGMVFVDDEDEAEANAEAANAHVVIRISEADPPVGQDFTLVVVFAGQHEEFMFEAVEIIQFD
jgi:hypothetical protein